MPLDDHLQMISFPLILRATTSTSASTRISKMVSVDYNHSSLIDVCVCVTWIYFYGRNPVIDWRGTKILLLSGVIYLIDNFHRHDHRSGVLRLPWGDSSPVLQPLAPRATSQWKKWRFLVFPVTELWVPWWKITILRARRLQSAVNLDWVKSKLNLRRNIKIPKVTKSKRHKNPDIFPSSSSALISIYPERDDRSSISLLRAQHMVYFL